MEKFIRRYSLTLPYFKEINIFLSVLVDNYYKNKCLRRVKEKATFNMHRMPVPSHSTVLKEKNIFGIDL